MKLNTSSIHGSIVAAVEPTPLLQAHAAVEVGPLSHPKCDFADEPLDTPVKATFPF
jgi:hypothetical protein